RRRCRERQRIASTRGSRGLVTRWSAESALRDGPEKRLNRFQANRSFLPRGWPAWREEIEQFGVTASSDPDAIDRQRSDRPISQSRVEFPREIREPVADGA